MNMDKERTFTRENATNEDIPGFTTTRRRKYKLEDLIEVYNKSEKSSEGMPTMNQVYEYGILMGMLEDLKAEVGIYFEEMQERWNSILEYENYKKNKESWSEECPAWQDVPFLAIYHRRDTE